MKSKYNLLILIAVAAASLIVSCYRSRRAEIVLIPDGYVGWVKIEYAISGANPLAVFKKSYEVTVPPNGHVQTSSEMAPGLASDRYYYVDGLGHRRELKIADSVDSSRGMIRATHYFTIPAMAGQNARTLRVFFVGSAQEYQRAKKDQDYLLSM